MIGGSIIESRDLGTIEHFDISAYIVDEPDTVPEDYADVYNDECLDAFYDNEWRFVTLGLLASRNGVALGHTFLSSVEHGWFPKPDDDKPSPQKKVFVNALDSATEPGYGLVDKVIADARTFLASLVR